MTETQDPPSAAPLIAPDLTVALKHYAAGAYGKAADMFAAGLKQAPDDPTLLRLNGLALTRAGQAAHGLPFLARAREIAPQEPLTHLHYGIGLQAAGRLAEAADIFRECLPLLPHNPAPALNLAAALLDLGRIDAACATAREAVARAPDSAEAHYMLGLAELTAREFAVARDELSEAVRLNPQFAKAWLNLGVAHYRLSDVRGAMEATKKCLAIEPQNNIAGVNMAVFLALRGEQEGAISRLRAILARDPDCIPARVNLGSQLVMDREHAEALEILQGTVPKGNLGAQWRAQRVSALLSLGRRAQARAELDAIAEPSGEAEILVAWRRLLFALSARERGRAEQLAQRMAELADDEAGPLLEHRIIAHFDLARFRSSRAERSRAFDHWRKGHALIARSQPFSRGESADMFVAIKEAYSRQRLANGPRANNRDTAPLFIVGLPRSGTTLMEQILSAHSAVHGAGERPHLFDCLSRLAGPAEQAESIRRAARLANPVLSVAARDYLVDLHKLAPRARYVADKMPGNALHLGFVATLLPRARIILCERDPRDVGLSIFQLRFFGYHPYAHDLADLGWYIGQHQKLMDYWAAVLPLPMLRVRLDEWVTDFQGTLRRVLDFLELPHEESCERFYAQPRKVRTASVDQVRKPVNARGIGRWRAFVDQLEPLFAELEHADILPGDVADAQLRATALSDARRPVAAYKVLERTLTRTPGSPALFAAMAMFRLRAGEHDVARALAEEAVAAAPHDASAHRALCNVLAYCDGVSGAELTEAMRRFGALLPRGAHSPPVPTPGQKIRLGLVGLFQRSPVTALTLRAFESLDRERFEIVCFSAGGMTDPITARYRQLGAFHELGHLDDAAFAQRIRAERVDILIELTGFLRGSRLAVLAHRPAPVQIKWAGAQYHTTGIVEADYFITDKYETPPELAPLYGEKLLVMPDSYVCWSPPEDAPDVSALPFARNGVMTFGSCNSLMKMTSATIAAWAKILERVPGSRLLLAAPAIDERETAERLREAFQGRGISGDRIELRGWMPHRALLNVYNEIDIALSPFPYNAGVTLLEGLWMGVPSVALSGESFVSRHGASHLAAVGLSDWAVGTVDAYVERAVAAANEPSRLADLRGCLREQLRASAICDAEKFAAAFGLVLGDLI